MQAFVDYLRVERNGYYNHAHAVAAAINEEFETTRSTSSEPRTPDQVLAEAAAKVTSNTTNVQVHLKAFFETVDSPFADLAHSAPVSSGGFDPNSFDEQTFRVLETLAPVSPNSDQVSPLNLTLDEDLYLHLGYRGQKGFPTPLYLVNPDLIKPKEIEQLGLVPLSASLVAYQHKDANILYPLQRSSDRRYLDLVVGNNEPFQSGRPYVALQDLEPFLKIPQNFGKLYAVKLVKVEPVQTDDPVFYINGVDSLVLLGVNPTTNKLTKMSSGSAQLHDKVQKYNTCWQNYFAAEAEWHTLRAESSQLGDVERVVWELVLLDLSRFGFAPCWSTPLSTPLQREDGRADEFFNDLADLKAEKKTKGGIEFFNDWNEYEVCRRQTAPQWRVARFMTSTDYLQILRQNQLSDLYNVTSVQNFVSQRVAGLPPIKKWLTAGGEKPGGSNTTGAQKQAADAQAAERAARRRDYRAHSAKHYAVDEGNDAFALALCFSEVGRRMRVAGPLPRQTWDFLHQLRLVALKTVATPMHATLRRPTREWAEGMHTIAEFLCGNIKNTKDSLNVIVESRSELVNAFLNAQSRKFPLLPTIANGGLLAGQATLCFNRPSLFVRLELHTGSAVTRDALVRDLKLIKNLKSSQTPATETDIEDTIQTLIEKFDHIEAEATASGTPPNEKLEKFRKEMNPQLEEFHVVYERTDLTKVRGWKEFSAAFKEMVAPFRIGQQRPKRTFTRTFVSDDLAFDILNLGNKPLVNSSLTDQIGSITSILKNRFKRATRARATIGAAPPYLASESYPCMLFPDPEVDTDALLVFEIDIGRIAVNSSFNDTAAVPADIYIDLMLAAIHARLPAHAHPNSEVQNALLRQLTLAGSRVLDAVVARAEVWVGPGTETPVRRFEDAVKISPVLPTATTAAQLRKYDKRLEATPSALTPLFEQKTPFSDVVANAVAVEAIKREVKENIQDAFGESTHDLHVANSDLDRVFVAETQYDMVPFASLGRVCRIGLELLKQAQAVDRFVQVRSLYPYNDTDLEGVDDQDDRLRIQLDYVPTLFGVQRRADGQLLDMQFENLMLPPFQHAAPYDAPEQRERFIPESDAQRAVFGSHTVQIALLLRYRLSLAAYQLDFVRQLYRKGKTDEFKNQRLQFEISAQAVVAFSRSVRENPGEDERGNTWYENVYARYFLPYELVESRLVKRFENTPPSPQSTASETTIKRNHYCAELYMTTSLRNVKALGMRPIVKGGHGVHPVVRGDGEAAKELRRVLAAMQTIGDGVESLNWLVARMQQAIKRLPQGRSTKKRALESFKTSFRSKFREFESNHAALSRALASYADAVSLRQLADDSAAADVHSELKLLIERSYRNVRKFRKNYNAADIGIAVLFANQLNDFVQAGQFQQSGILTARIKVFFEGIDVMMTSDLFRQKTSRFSDRVGLLNELKAALPSLKTYATLAARAQVNAALGCLEGAAAFRNLPELNEPTHKDKVQRARAFDVLRGFAMANSGKLNNFHCSLPLAKDVFGASRAVAETCTPP